MICFKKGQAANFISLSKQTGIREPEASRYQWKVVHKPLPWRLEMMLKDLKRFEKKTGKFFKKTG